MLIYLEGNNYYFYLILDILPHLIIPTKIFNFFRFAKIPLDMITKLERLNQLS